MMVATKETVCFAALIAAGLIIADEASTRIIQVSPALGQYLFQTGAKTDNFNELRQNELQQRARAALQALIEQQAANQKQQISTVIEGDQFDARPTGTTCSQRACNQAITPRTAAADDAHLLTALR